MKISLGNDKHTTVDAVDFPFLNQWKWHFKPKGNGCVGGYAYRWSRDKRVWMHRVILGTKVGFVIDHINGDGTDNRKKNLRFCTQSENLLNMKKVRGISSGYKGIHWDKRLSKWRVRIQVNNKKIHLGMFKSKKEAITVCKKFYAGVIVVTPRQFLYI